MHSVFFWYFANIVFLTPKHDNAAYNQLHAGGSGVRLYDGPDSKLFILVGWDRSILSVAWPAGVQLVFFFCSRVSKLFGAQGSPSSGSLLNL